MTGLVDIHSHILPGLDDGSGSLGESLDMLAAAAESGVRIITATPHSYMADYGDESVREEMFFLLEQLDAESAAAGIDIRVLPGMEVLIRENIVPGLQSGRYLTLNRTSNVLCEFDFEEEPDFMSSRLREIVSAGYTPVVAHPERYRAVRRDNMLAYHWCLMGCMLQVNKGSLVGAFGDDVAHCAHNLLRWNIVSAVASDAHSVVTRGTSMNDAVMFITENYSEEYAVSLLSQRPAAILTDKRDFGRFCSAREKYSKRNRGDR